MAAQIWYRRKQRMSRKEDTNLVPPRKSSQAPGTPVTFRFPRTGRLYLAALAAGVLCLVLATTWTGAGHAQEAVTIKGIVENGTEGAALPPDLRVLLLITGPDGRLIATDHTAATGEGRFRFEQAPRTDTGSYALSVDYADVFYGASFSLEELADEVRLTVYEPTQDVSIIRIKNQVMVLVRVDKKSREVAAVEFVRLVNDSDRTLLPDVTSAGMPSFLRFALPPLAEDLDVGSDLSGGDIVSIGTGFALTSPVVPGDHFVEFSFRFPYQEDSVSYRQSLPQGADVYQVMLPKEFAGIEVSPLQALPDVEVEDVTYQVWEQRGIVPGQGVGLQLTGLPQPGLGARLQNSLADGTLWQVAIPVALGAAFAALLLWGALKPGRWAPEPGGASAVAPAPAPADRDRIVREIASLDEGFQSGAVTENDYRQRRESLVAQVLGPGNQLD